MNILLLVPYFVIKKVIVKIMFVTVLKGLREMGVNINVKLINMLKMEYVLMIVLVIDS